MGKSSSPDTPDIFPGDIRDVRKMIRAMERSAQRQGVFNLGLGAVGQRGPQGTIRFKGTPGEENFRVIQRLPKRQRKLLRQSRRAQRQLQRFGQEQIGRVGDILSQPVLGGQDLISQGADVERATFERGRNLLQPGFDEQTSRLENQLVQRGIPRNSSAFDREMERLSDQQGTALENLALQAVQAGRDEQSRLLGADISRRGAMLSEIMGLAVPGAGAQAPGGFLNTPQGAAPAVNPAAPFNSLTQAGLAGLQGQAGLQQAGKGGAFGLAAAGLPLIFKG